MDAAKPQQPKPFQKKSQQHSKNFKPHSNIDETGTWKNTLEPPVTLAEMLSKITVTSEAPAGFLSDLQRDFSKELTAIVVQK